MSVRRVPFEILSVTLPPMHEIQINWHSRDEYERITDVRKRHGMRWRGVLLEGGKHAESYDLLKALLDLNPELVTDDGDFSRLKATTSLAKAASRQRQRLYKKWDARENEDIHPTSPHASEYETLLGNSAAPIDERDRVGSPWETADYEGDR